MSRDRKIGLNWYGYTDRDTLAAHLEKLHEKSWHLEDTTGATLRFRRGEREKVRYAITYFPEASVYDARPTEGQMTYADYCAQAGWEFVCAYGPIQYFRSTRPDPIPIETDEGEKLRAIHRTVLKTQGFSWLWLSALTVFLAWLMLASFSRRPLEFAASNTLLAGCLVEGSFLLTLLWDMGGYWLWYIRSRLSVSGGGRCPAGGRLRRCGTWVLVTVMALLLALYIFLSGNRLLILLRLALYTLLLFGCYRLLLTLKSRGYERGEARSTYMITATIAAVLFAVGMNIVDSHAEDWGLVRPRQEMVYVYTRQEAYPGALPVTLEDLGVSVEEEYLYSRLTAERSLLAAHDAYDQSCRTPSVRDRRPSLYYTVTVIPWDWLRERCWREQIHYYETWKVFVDLVDEPRWGAAEVRKGSVDTEERYMLLYGDRIVLLCVSDLELTDGQVDILAQRLGQVK